MMSNTATAPAEFEPIRLLPPTEKLRDELISEAGWGTAITEQMLWLPLAPAPSQTWRSGFVHLWRKNFGGNLPALNDAGFGFPLAVAYVTTGGLNGYIAQLKQVIDETNEKYVRIYEQEQRERDEKEAQKQERMKQMSDLLDSIRID